jgi:hypothetical protein
LKRRRRIAYSARSFGTLDKAAETNDGSTFNIASQPWLKHFSSPRVTLKTMSISQSPHKDPDRMCAHDDPTAFETKEERYGRVSAGISALHFIHVVA